MSVQRLFPLAGAAFVALVLVSALGLGGTDSPETGASAAELSAFYGDDTWRQFGGAFLFAASVPFLALFAVEIARTALAGGRAAWAGLLLVGTAVTGAVLLVVATCWLALADAADNDLAGTVLQPLNQVVSNGWVGWNAGLGVTMLGAAGCLWTGAGAERRLSRVALVLGIVLFIPFADFPALVLTLVWIVVVSIMRARVPLAAVAAPLPAG